MFKTAELGYLKDKYLYQMSLLIFILLEIEITFLMLICMYTYIDNFSNLTHVHIYIFIALAVKRARYKNISHQCPCNKLYFFKYRTGYDRKYIFALAQTFMKILQSISKQIRTWIVVLPII